MEKFTFECPECKTVLEAEKEWINVRTECPGCGKGIIIPNPCDENISNPFGIKKYKKLIIACGITLFIFCMGFLSGALIFSKSDTISTKNEAQSHQTQKRNITVYAKSPAFVGILKGECFINGKLVKTLIKRNDGSYASMDSVDFIFTVKAIAKDEIHVQFTLQNKQGATLETVETETKKVPEYINLYSNSMFLEVK